MGNGHSIFEIRFENRHGGSTRKRDSPMTGIPALDMALASCADGKLPSGFHASSAIDCQMPLSIPAGGFHPRMSTGRRAAKRGKPIVPGRTSETFGSRSRQPRSFVICCQAGHRPRGIIREISCCDIGRRALEQCRFISMGKLIMA